MMIDVHRGWRADDALLSTLRGLFEFDGDRATGYLYGDQPWPAPLAEVGPELLADLDALLGIRFEQVAWQAYRNGAGCDWHADTPFDAQAILSLGVSRTFGTRPRGGEPSYITVHHGDLVVMPAGLQASSEHCVPTENRPGVRCSIVARTVVRS